MELYHIHLLGNKDKLYKEKKEININPSTFNNRLYNKTINTSFSIPIEKYKKLAMLYNNTLFLRGFSPCTDRVNIQELIPFIDVLENPSEFYRDLHEILFNASIAKREISLENFRKEYASDKPSRLHSMYACDENGLELWKNVIGSNKYEIFRINPIDEPFRTNEGLLPKEETSYIDSYNSSNRYFNPKSSDLNKPNDEYLIQGKVKLLELVYKE